MSGRRRRPAAPVPLLALFLLAAVAASGALAQGAAASAPELLARAELLRLSEDLPGAVEAYLAALSRNPSYGEAYHGLAECYYALEEYDQALSYAAKAAPYLRGSAALANLEAFIRVGRGEVALAKTGFEAVLRREPNNLDARFGLAMLELLAGRKDEARLRLEDSARLAPDNARALLSLALVAQDQGKAAEAAALAERALRAHGQEPRAQYVAALVAARAGRREEALKRARTALELKPSYAEARRLAGTLLYESASYEEAVALMREAIGYDRGDLSAWYTLAMAQAAAGKTGEAVFSLRTALAQRPDDEIVRIALEQLVMDSTALEDPSRAPLADFHFQRAAEFEQRSSFDQALFEYRRGLTIHPDSKKGRAAYAELLRKRGLPARQLAELVFLKENGLADRAVLDAIEIYSSLLQDGVAAGWDLDQFALPKRPYKVALYSLSAAGEAAHTGSPSLLLRYLGEMLGSSSRLRVLPTSGAAARVRDAGEAFRKGRESGADYYLVLAARESEREVELSAELRVARTGSLATSFRAYRTGNDRVRNTASRLAELLVASLEPKGSILRRSQDRVLVDLGALDGFKAGDRLIVLRRGRLGVLHEGLGPSWTQPDLVGTISLDRVDEEVAEGTLKSAQFFDTINVGDEVIREPAPKETAGGPGGAAAAGGAKGAAQPAAKAPGTSSSPAAVAPQAPRLSEPEWTGLFDTIRRLR